MGLKQYRDFRTLKGKEKYEQRFNNDISPKERSSRIKAKANKYAPDSSYLKLRDEYLHRYVQWYKPVYKHDVTYKTVYLLVVGIRKSTWGIWVLVCQSASGSETEFHPDDIDRVLSTKEYIAVRSENLKVITI